ncbi:hypothetical protein ACJIZ3_020052 [Penstemon smallii]|uniref:Cyclin-like domain-containing protein n=1 Tax=Penstemon smallii TaxID=265156 RepID=A0ABD3SIB7_9LAMI
MKRKLASRATDEEALSSVAGTEKPQHLQFTKRQLRSRLPRRRRIHISPLIILSSTAAADLSHSAAEVTEEVSCNSSVASVSNHKAPPLPPANFRYELRRLATRSNYRNEISKFDEPLEVSENSCVESCSGANDVRELFKLKSANVEESEAEGGGGEVSKSEVSSAPPRFPLAEKDVVRVRANENSAVEIVRDDVVSKYNNNLLENDGVSVDNSAVYCLDLACSEKFSNGAIIGDGDEEEEEEEQNSSSSGSFVEVLSDLEYTPSIWSYTSGSQFSEADEKCSPCFQLFSQFKQQLCRSTFSLAAFANDCTSFEFTLLGLVDVEDEESYRMLMKRERRQVYLRDYAEEYCNTTDYGHLVIQQRLHMVHWIVEQATTNKLQMETMFLGVSFLDRFLAKGYFKNIRHLQIAGIACLALATRIEENQPYNCVRTETFYVGWAAYGRSEVVAMEWLVQEVLNFQCFLPTLYNFLWFYLKAARANKNVEKTAKYLAVLALMGHQQLCYWPSTVAAGLVILASIAAKEDASCHLITAIHVRQKDKDLPECIKSMEWLVKYL